MENKEKTYYTDTDLHTHTIASGHATTDTIALLAKAAFLRGMKCLGISDHGPASMGSAGLSYFWIFRIPFCRRWITASSVCTVPFIPPAPSGKIPSLTRKP